MPIDKILDTHDQRADRISVNRANLLRRLSKATSARDITALKKSIAAIKRLVVGRSPNAVLANGTGEAILLRKDVLIQELDQVLAARTLERARYYVRRLGRGVADVKTAAINDINLLRWKEYEEVLTDSLWVVPRRDTAGSHAGWYWGNFIPQIPRQLMLRYTRRGDWVLDAFAGSGTTLIESRRLGRNSIGVELNPEIATRAAEIVSNEPNHYGVDTEILIDDARSADVRTILRRHRASQVQLLILHPPYHDIIAFSDDKSDLSAATSAESFLHMLGEVVDNFTPLLERGRYLALVIGDKYAGGEWVPLGFYSMNEVLKRDYTLKSIIVKNFEETRAKRDQKQLWRYRALAGGFYIFKHEYIFLFRKK
jgi:DNA modification methylase